jgi:hypothetical protein
MKHRIHIALIALCLAAIHLPVAGQTASSLAGRVRDADSNDPVADVVVRLLGTPFATSSDDRGIFRFGALEPGEYTLRVSHLAFGTHEERVIIQEGTSRLVEIRISMEAIALEPLVVEAMTSQGLSALGSGSSVRVMEREEIALMEGSVSDLSRILVQKVPGVRVRRSQGLAGSPICIELRGAAFNRTTSQCRSPAVYMDGVPVMNPDQLYGNIPLSDIERLEVIPPSSAGVRYGIEASHNGAILIDTRDPMKPFDWEGTGARTETPMLEFDWSMEPDGHHTTRVFIASLLGNAAGLAAGLAIADDCLEIRPPSYDSVRTNCEGWATMGSIAAAAAFPAFGAAAAARFAGGTDLSHGRLGPSVGASLMALVPGYAMHIAARRSEWPTTGFVGRALIVVGAPLAVTIADRLFRKIRSDKIPLP